MLARFTFLVALAAALMSDSPKAKSPDSAGPDVKSIVSLLEARYRSPRTLQATFLERYTENSKLIRTEAGRVYFRRPGKMRWEYESPEKNVFLVDGKNAWFYVPADHSVTRVSAKESTDWRTPLALLAGEMKLSRICNKIEYAPKEAPEFSTDVMLYCELRGASKSNRGGDSSKLASPEAQDAVYLEVAVSSGELVRILMKDPAGVGIEFRFANWQSDPSLPDSFFRFQVPPGVAIVNGELTSGQNRMNP